MAELIPFRPADTDKVRAAIDDLKAFQATHSLGGLSIRDMIDVARTHRLSAYDAMCLELAIRMQLPLATLDRALAAAGRAAGVDVPTVTRPE